MEAEHLTTGGDIKASLQNNRWWFRFKTSPLPYGAEVTIWSKVQKGRTVMPCDSVKREASAAAIRQKQIADLTAALKAKTASVTNRDGKVSINGWTNRGEWCDECAVRSLKQSTDFTIRAMIAAATPVGKAVTFGHTHSHGSLSHTH